MTDAIVEKTCNGVDVEQLRAHIEALKAKPELGTFRFRCRNVWMDGGFNRTRIQDFFGVGGENTERREPFVLDADEPPVLLGQDRGPNPVEYLLTALTACVMTSMVYHAAARGIAIRKLSSHTEGELDLRGFLGIDPNVPKGFQRIRITFEIEADAPQEQLDEIVALGPSFSPVYDTIVRAVPVEVTRG